MNLTVRNALVLLSIATALTACGDDTSAVADAGDAPNAGSSGDGDGGDGDGDGDGDAGGGYADPDAEVTVPREFLADAGDGWLTLITGEWSLPAGEEGYICARFTLPEDTYVSAMKPLIPLGTHHTVLTIGEPSGPDGITECDAFQNHSQQVGGSGVGTDPQIMPDGVAVRLLAGQQLLLNLHLFNSGEEEISGQSGTLIRTVDEAEVDNAAEIILAGTIDLSIPPGETTVQTGRCTFTQPGTVFAVLPHMHMLGVHMKVTAETAADGDIVLVDEDYSFEQQDSYDIDFVELEVGDTLKVECTYTNDREEMVEFGDSSRAEMCFAGVMRYPAANGANFTCIN